MAPRDPVPFRLMLRTGRAAVWRYAGLLTSLFLLQVALAGGAAWVVSRILENALGTSLVFDEAVDGDVVAMIATARLAPDAILASLWVCVGAVCAYLAVSWFTTGGLLAVLIERPAGRRDVARCFGAGGAASFFAYARLAAMSALPYAIILLAGTLGVMVVGAQVAQALSPWRAAATILAGLAPAVVMAWVTFTIVDYARVDLSLHPGLGATAAALRAVRTVLSRPAPLLHVALYYLVFLAASIAYVFVTYGHAMLGTGGAISLLVVREGLAILRFTAKVAMLAGQVELGQKREPPRRRAAVS